MLPSQISRPHLSTTTPTVHTLDLPEHIGIKKFHNQRVAGRYPSRSSSAAVFFSVCLELLVNLPDSLTPTS
jgi:hypothetical protein